MTDELKPGDRVEWKTSNGKTVGEVEQKLMQPTDIKQHHVAASKQDPQYLVKSEKSGKEAAHKPESLKKIAK
jgi:Hypervirulence associated proteins TUDOR domain